MTHINPDSRKTAIGFTRKRATKATEALKAARRGGDKAKVATAKKRLTRIEGDLKRLRALGNPSQSHKTKTTRNNPKTVKKNNPKAAEQVARKAPKSEQNKKLTLHSRRTSQGAKRRTATGSNARKRTGSTSTIGISPTRKQLAEIRRKAPRRRASREVGTFNRLSPTTSGTTGSNARPRLISGDSSKPTNRKAVAARAAARRRNLARRNRRAGSPAAGLAGLTFPSRTRRGGTVRSGGGSAASAAARARAAARRTTRRRR